MARTATTGRRSTTRWEMRTEHSLRWSRSCAAKNPRESRSGKRICCLDARSAQTVAARAQPRLNYAKRSGRLVALFSCQPVRGPFVAYLKPARVFSSPLRATAGGVRAGFGTSVPRHRLDEPGGCEVLTQLGDLIDVVPTARARYSGVAMDHPWMGSRRAARSTP